MNATIRGLKGLLALGALAGLGLVLRWVTAGTADSAASQDLTALATLAIGTVAWVAYAWLLIAVLATVLEQVPGAVGRSASAVATRITSQGSRALLRSALGVAAVTPLTIGVAHAAPGDTGPQRPWTAIEPASTVRLTDQPTRTTQPGQTRLAVPKRPQDNVPARRVGIPDRPTEGAPTRYTDLQTGRVVKPGDSLWALASDELGPDAGNSAVAARWPQWYSANRALIGPDPDLIHPGQKLHTPAAPPGQEQRTSVPTDQPVPPTHQEK